MSNIDEEKEVEFEEGQYEQEEGFEEIPEDDPRASIYDKIDAKRAEEMAKEPEAVPFESSPGVFEEEKKTEKEPAEEGETEQEGAPEPPPAQPTVIRIKVNGVDKDVPYDEAVKILQMTTAAEAARKLQEATNRKVQPEEAKRTEHSAPAFRLPDDIRRELLDVENKLFYEGAATKEEADKLLQRRVDLNFELTFSAQKAMEAEMRMREEQENRARIGEALVSTVAKAHPDFQTVMFAVDETGAPRKNQYGMNELNSDFGAWLAAQPASVKYAALESDDPRDPIDVLNRFKEFKRGGTSLEERAKQLGEKKKTIDPVKSGTGKVPGPAAYKEPSRAEVIAEMRQYRAKQGAY